MDASQSTSIGAAVLAVIGWAAATFERVKSSRSNERERLAREAAGAANQQHAVNQQILDGKDELIRIARESSDAWKAKYETEHAEFAEYRKKAHDLTQEAQAKLLHLAEDNSALRAKTDLTPILAFQKEAMDFYGKQNAIHQQIVNSLQAIQQKLAAVQVQPGASPT